MLGLLMTMHTESYLKRPIDDKLLLKIANGDMNALNKLYECTSSSVYGFALSIVKNTHDADDVLQETFLKVYSNAAQYKSQGKPMAWILTIARNLALNKIRKTSIHAELDISRPQELDFSQIENIEQRILLQKLFTHLTDQEKQILMLHAVSGMKHREIAQILGLSVNTVLSKYSRAVKRLKLVLEEAE